MKKTFAIISSCLSLLALGDQAPKEIAKFMPDCTFMKSANSGGTTSYVFHCDKNESLMPPEELTQCKIDSKNKNIIDCVLSAADSKTAPSATRIKINCTEEGAAWAKHPEKHQWICTLTTPQIAGCKYTHENEQTGFYEYSCDANAKLIEAETKGKCEAGDTNAARTAYYCFSPEVSADAKLVLKCATGWVKSPTNPNEFTCGAASKKPSTTTPPKNPL